MRRFVYRKDGLVSVRAERGGLTTRVLTFKGRQLVVNHRARSRDGSIRVELLDDAGTPIDGFTASDCVPLKGDQLASRVTWKGQRDLARLSGTPIKLRFVIRNAELFSIRFR